MQLLALSTTKDKEHARSQEGAKHENASKSRESSAPRVLACVLSVMRVEAGQVRSAAFFVCPKP